MAYNLPADSEVDTNSPGNETLMQKIKDSIEYLGDHVAGHSHDGSAAGEGPTIAQGGLKTATEEESSAVAAHITFSSVGSYGFYPQVRGNIAAATGAWQLMGLPGVGGHTHRNPGTTYITSAGLTVTDNTHYIQIRYIQASRNFPVVYIKRHIPTGDVIGIHFDPECGGYENPFHTAGQDMTDMEVFAIELNRNVVLKKHLYANYGKADRSWCYQIGLGLFVGAIELKEKIEPLKPNMTDEQKQWMDSMGLVYSHDVNKTDTTPALYSPNVKVVDFEFHKELIK